MAISKSKLILLVVLFVTVATVIFLMGGVPGLGGLDDFEWAQYESPEALARGGNFSFKYPSLFEMKSDEWRIDQSGERHSVIFMEKTADDDKDEAAVLEVNVTKGSEACSEYDACEVVDEVAIGIKGGSRNLRGLLPEIVASFKVVSPE